jgi:L-alanine-DL-glutamate epimerase-like enolase superfamily enzyme
MLPIRFEILKLPLKYTWRLSRNASDVKENILLSWVSDGFIWRGEAAPNVRYGESAAAYLSILPVLIQHIPASIVEQPEKWTSWLEQNVTNRSLRMAFDMLFWNRIKDIDPSLFNSFMGVEPSTVASCYTIPVMSAYEIQHFVHTHALYRFQAIKIKIGSKDAAECIQEVHRQLPEAQLWIDANEAFATANEILGIQKAVKNIPISFFEQPFPSDRSFISVNQSLKRKSLFPIMADESVLDQVDWSEFSSQFHGINMKLMKAGTLLRGIDLLTQAKRSDLKCMIGCMVETTLALESSFRISNLADYADLDSFMLLQHEPFGLLTEKNGLIQRL